MIEVGDLTPPIYSPCMSLIDADGYTGCHPLGFGYDDECRP